MSTATTPIDLRAERLIRVLAPISLLHSIVYAVLIVLAITPTREDVLTPLFGYGHGLLWIGLSLVCVTAAGRGLLPVRTALAVAILGAVGPFIGTYEFMRLRRNGGATFRST